VGIIILLPSFSFCVADDSTTAVSAISLPAPLGLSATAISQGEIRLTWSVVSGAAGYKVYRGGVLIASPTTNAYSDTGLSPKTTYSYTVSSVNAFGGESVQSSSVSAATLSGMSGGFGSSNPPPGGFQISINNGAKHTDDNIVTLDLTGGPDADRMIISNFPDFRDVHSQEPYAVTKEWDLCKGRTSCPGGEYTVYVKFSSPGKQASETISYDITYNRPAVESIFERIKAAIDEASQRIADLRGWIVQLAQKPVKISEEPKESGAPIEEMSDVSQKEEPAEEEFQEKTPPEEKEAQSKKSLEEKTETEKPSFFDSIKDKTLLLLVVAVLLIAGFWIGKGKMLD